jgi:hypothetical protein
MLTMKSTFPQRQAISTRGAKSDNRSMIGRLCQVHIHGYHPGQVLFVYMYDDIGAWGPRLFPGDIVVPIARDRYQFYILTQHGVGRLEGEFIKEV